MARITRIGSFRRIAESAMCVIVLMLAQSVAAQVGATYFVSKAGNDGNPGTIGSPWSTIQHAANSVSAGATVYVFGGVYNESVNFPSSGTASAPLHSRVIRARPP